MTALVTGATGFVAQTLAPRLRQEPGLRLAGCSRSARRNTGAWDEFSEVDLTAPDQVKAMLKAVKPGWIFHLAGANTGSDETLFRVNLLSGVILLEAVREVCPQASVLLVGSAAEYGVTAADDGVPISETRPCRPRGAYGASKFALTTYGLDFASRTQVRVSVARPFNIVGPGMPDALLVGALLKRVAEARALGRRAIKVGAVDSQRDFVDVRDAAEAMVRIIKADAAGEIFNICSGRPTPVRAVVETILKLDGTGLSFEVDPSLSRPTDPKSIAGDPAKLAARTGFHPVRPLDESLRMAWEAAAK